MSLIYHEVRDFHLQINISLKIHNNEVEINEKKLTEDAQRNCIRMKM